MGNGTDKGAGCFGMSAGCGGEVGFNSGGSGEVSDKVDIGICVRNVFAEEEDGGVGGLC